MWLVTKKKGKGTFVLSVNPHCHSPSEGPTSCYTWNLLGSFFACALENVQLHTFIRAIVHGTQSHSTYQPRAIGGLIRIFIKHFRNEIKFFRCQTY